MFCEQSKYRFFFISSWRSYILLTALCVFSYSTLLNSQIQVQTSNNEDLSIDYLIESVFLGNGIQINSINRIGSGKSIGLFTNGASDINLSQGLVLSTGSVSSIDKPNSSNSTGDTADEDFVVSDPDLQALTDNDIKEVTGIEIEFVAQSSDLEFRYVFASEEYPEFTCSKFNDIFAFFIDGPNPNGGNYDKENIALVPDPSDPTGNTFTDFPVWTNSVNSGIVGDGTNGESCDKDDESLMFSQYYNDNTGSLTFTFDGFLDVFKAKAQLIPCQTYTIKIIIGDNNDFDFDSAVFLEAKSLSTRNYQYYVDAGVNNTLYEGCNKGKVGIRFDQPVTERTVIPLEVTNGSNSAVLDEDYSISSNQFVIEPGQSTAEIEINVFDDGIAESVEYLRIGDNSNGCTAEELVVLFQDNPIESSFVDFKDASVCINETLFDVNLPNREERYLEYNSSFSIRELGTSSSPEVVIPISLDNIEQVAFNQIFSELCIDGFTHEDLSEIEILIQSPDGRIAKLVRQGSLSGSSFGERFCIEQSEEVAFLLDRFDDAVINGIWNILIRDQVINSNRGSIDRWSLRLDNPNYFDYSLTTSNGGVFDPTTPLTSDLEITIAATNLAGCTYSNVVSISVIDDIVSPTDLTCTEIDRDILQFSWSHINNNIHFEVNVGDGWVEIGNVFTHTVSDLAANQTVPFAVRAIGGNCSSAEADLVCGTPQCIEPEIIISRRSNNTSACEPNGLFELRSTNTKGPYTYKVDGVDVASNIIDGLTEGIYEVEIIDGYGCNSITQVNIEGIPQVELELEVFDAFCGQQGFIDLFVTGGTPPYTFLWSTNSTERNVNGLDAGDYTVIVRDQSGCEFVETVSIRQSSALEINNIQTIDPSCFNTSDGSVTYNVSGGASDQPLDIIITDSDDQMIADPMGLSFGKYRIEATDMYGCISIDSFIINRPDSIVIDEVIAPPACSFVSDGRIELNISGGTGPYEISWNNGIINQDILDNVAAGTYEVLITDSNGCSNSKVIELEAIENPIIEYEVSQISCFDESDGSINLSSTNSQLSVEWEDGTFDLLRTGLSAGTLCGRVFTQSGCYIDTCFTLINPQSISVEALVQNNICFGFSDGKIELDIDQGTGPYVVEHIGVITETEGAYIVDNLSTGMQEFRITDSKGCSISSSFNIDSAPEVMISAEIVNNSCKGDELGKISPSIVGVSGISSVLWIGPDSTEYSTLSLSNLGSGEYFYQITSVEGCSYSRSFEVTEPADALSADFTLNDLSCYNSSDGTINVTASGGIGSKSFEISSGQVSNNGIFEGLNAGIFDVTVSDESGCTFVIEDIEVIEPVPFSIDLSVDTIAYEFQDLDLNVEIIGSQGEVDLFWDSDPIDQLPCTNCDSVTIIALENTLVVAVEAIDDNGCEAYDEKKIFIQRANHVSIPTAFTPNGDNANDQLFMYGTPGAIIRVFSVYDRTGVRLYYDQDIEVNTESKGWDGIFKGSPMPAGAYMWTAIADFVDGRSETFSGSVQLIR